MTTTEDDIIKKRLLIEGDSGNEDRLINKLIKNFVKWTNSFYNTSNLNGDGSNFNDEESSEFLYEQLTANLAHTEFGLLRNQFILEMNQAEQQNYDVLYQKINSEIEKAKKKIVENKVELQEARKIRKNRQEYDVLAKQILNYPDRLEMQNTIKNLEAKVESLKKAESDYDRKIDLRRKQFSVVLQSVSSLKNLIETDTNLDEYLNVQPACSTNEDEMQSEPISQSQVNGSEANNEANNNHDEMDDEPSSHNKREKYSVPEVEMEES